MRSRALTITGALAALACSAASAPALAAAHPAQGPATAPRAHASGLLDGLGGGLGGGGLGGGLGGIVGGLLGDGQQQLQQLLGQLQGGQAPTGALLAPVQQLLAQLAAAPGLPVSVQGLVQQITDLLGSGRAADPLPANVLMPVAQLLRDLAGTQGVPAELTTLLSQLADTLDGDGSVDGLPVDGLSLPPALVSQLRDVLSQLEQGEQPTGRLLAPVAALLDQVAGTPGLPDELSSMLGQLGDTLESTTGALDPLLSSQLSLALRTVAGTPGLPGDARTTIERIATMLGGSQSAAGSSGAGRGSAAGRRAARTATARDRAVIKRITVNRARTRIAVRIACPKSAPASCATAVTAKLGGRKAAQGKRVRIGAGHAKVVRLRMASAARTSSVQHGGRLRVRVTTSFGKRRFAVAKALRLKASTR